jgi:hypothetical protein
MSYQRPIWEARYIPDCSIWTSTGITAPFNGSYIHRIGNTLYAFGGTATGEIYTAPWDDSTTWTDTGSSVGSTLDEKYVARIDSNLYAYPSGGNIRTATIANPLVWSDTGISFGSRNNAPLIVTPNYITMYGGHNGSAPNDNVAYASTSTPTSFSTASSISASNWQRGGCYLGGDQVYIFGDCGSTTSLEIVLESVPGSRVGSVTTTQGYSINGTPMTFNVDDMVWVVGNANANVYSTNITDNTNFRGTWRTHSDAFSTSLSYIKGSGWIGPDGYAYVIPMSGLIWKSRRQLIYVTDPLPANGQYANRRAVNASGKNCIYTVHCQMGMCPWFTNTRASL